MYIEERHMGCTVRLWDRIVIQLGARDNDIYR